MTLAEYISVVVIGRNEGDRLERCLRSIPSGLDIVYVDSGSTDGSVAIARNFATSVVEMSSGTRFTAARARNAGLAILSARPSQTPFVQMMDGDCELNETWLAAAVEVIRLEPELVAVFGRLRERFPDLSVYNRMCDDEWNVPIGDVKSCGGNALFRLAPLVAIGGYSPGLIAGEEPDLCLRLRHVGWKIRRIALDMMVHDAAILRFGQWWQRSRRSGHAYIEHVALHRNQANDDWRRAVVSILSWGGALPLAIFGCAALSVRTSTAITPTLGALFLYLVQWLRIASRKADETGDRAFGRIYATLTIVGKFSSMLGVLSYCYAKVRGADAQLIEYKE